MKKIRNPKSAIRNPKMGMTLFAVLAILAGLSLISATLFTIVATDIKIAGNFKYSQQAFYNADAGIAYVLTEIEDDLAAGTLGLSNDVENVSYTAPSGFDFDPITNLTRATDESVYSFRVTGYNQDASASIDVVMKRKPALNLGIFGNADVDMKANGSVYSYDSSVTPNPTPADSTGEADVGANEGFITHSGTYIDGDLLIGEDQYGNPGTWLDPGTGATITGEPGASTDNIDPDPLGAVGGDLATDFTAASVSNNNASAVPPIVANQIQLGAGNTMSLSAGTYYVSSIILNNSATLMVDASAGPVNIFLTGQLDAKAGSAINLVGIPPNFTIYSNSSQPISLFNSSTFKGTLYAPYASVEIKNDADFYGLVWADYVDIKNSGNLYIDVSIVEARLSDEVLLLSWKEVRE